MESFVRSVAPIVIALFGFVVILIIVRLITERNDPVDVQKKGPAGRPDSDR